MFIIRMHDGGELDVRACYTAISVSLGSLCKHSHAFALFSHPAFTYQSYLVIKCTYTYLMVSPSFTSFYQVASVLNILDDKLVENLGNYIARLVLNHKSFYLFLFPLDLSVVAFVFCSECHWMLFSCMCIMVCINYAVLFV